MIRSHACKNNFLIQELLREAERDAGAGDAAIGGEVSVEDGQPAVLGVGVLDVADAAPVPVGIGLVKVGVL